MVLNWLSEGEPCRNCRMGDRFALNSKVKDGKVSGHCEGYVRFSRGSLKVCGEPYSEVCTCMTPK